MKYILYTDYCAGQNKQYEYRELSAKTLLEAIGEADKIRKSDPLEIYLTRIMEYHSTEKEEGCSKKEIYRAVLCERSHGWHLNDIMNSESDHYAAKRIYRDRTFEIECL